MARYKPHADVERHRPPGLGWKRRDIKQRRTPELSGSAPSRMQVHLLPEFSSQTFSTNLFPNKFQTCDAKN